MFPLIPGDKRPREKGWTRTATRDPEEIERLWRDPVTGWEQDFNVGVLCDHMIVLDIDVKGGRRGMESAAELGVLSDALETLTVRTRAAACTCTTGRPEPLSLRGEARRRP